MVVVHTACLLSTNVARVLQSEVSTKLVQHIIELKLNYRYNGGCHCRFCPGLRKKRKWTRTKRTKYKKTDNTDKNRTKRTSGIKIGQNG